MLVSIIIPTLNEETNIPLVLRTLLPLAEIEIIFSDGGSSDKTCDVIGSFLSKYRFIQLIQSVRGRAVQMNTGARKAAGEWLVFLHADTIIPETSWIDFRDTLEKSYLINSGSFQFKVSSHKLRYRMMEILVNLRTRFFKLPYGDQALFVRKNQFEKMNGFREDYPLMEDVEFVGRLSKEKGFQILRVPIYTSPRRHEKDGFYKRISLNFLINVLYRMGVHPRDLIKYYSFS